MQALEFLNGISPWWWVAFALALGALEMATFSFFLIWPALAALITAAMLLASPDLSSSAQISIFALVSIALTFAGRMLFNKYGDGGGEEDEILNKRGARFIGRSASVLEYANGEGFVEIEGMRWRAIWPADQMSDMGQKVRITKADGLVLTVEPIIG
jgi:membrane protein implicated in regulation of membrane protease activity